MAEIRLQFVLTPGLSSWAISWFSAGHLSHVDAVLPLGLSSALPINLVGANGLLGARSDKAGGRPAGVQVRPMGYEKFTARTVASLNVTDAQWVSWAAFLAGQIGKPYDNEAIWAFAFNRDWREPDSWICSELQARALEVAGVVPLLYLAANKITPTALALAVSAAGGKFDAAKTSCAQ